MYMLVNKQDVLGRQQQEVRLPNTTAMYTLQLFLLRTYTAI